MRTLYWLVVLVLAVVLTTVVVNMRSRSGQNNQVARVFTPVGTIREIMEGIVEPSSDVIFGAVSTTINATGEVNKMPKNDEEWGVVQHNALMLAEAANLIRMQGRIVARPGEATDVGEPDAPELTPEQIQEKKDRDPSLWNMYAGALQDTAVRALAAANGKNVDTLFEVGDAIDKACENCHLEYWYPNQKKAAAQ